MGQCPDPKIAVKRRKLQTLYPDGFIISFYGIIFKRKLLFIKFLHIRITKARGDLS